MRLYDNLVASLTRKAFLKCAKSPSVVRIGNPVRKLTAQSRKSVLDP